MRDGSPVFPPALRAAALGANMLGALIRKKRSLMPRPTLPTATRKLLAACLGLGTVLLLMTSAEAADSRVRSACMDDYFAYCSQHDPDGSGVRRCMRTNGRKLSATCLNALVAAGEVSKNRWLAFDCVAIIVGPLIQRGSCSLFVASGVDLPASPSVSSRGRRWTLTVVQPQHDAEMTLSYRSQKRVPRISNDETYNRAIRVEGKAAASSADWPPMDMGFGFCSSRI